jgi:opacity protein-like surface antigen
MRFKPISMLLPAVLFLAANLPASAQSHYSAERGGWPLVVGGGASQFNMDWGHAPNGNQRILTGVTVWAEWNRLPHLPKGLGMAVEGEHINWGQPANLPQLRIDAGLGGPMYTWRHYKRINLYGKCLFGLGGLYFPPLGNYSHDTRTVTAPGGGADFRAWNSFWLRADYEYQFWPDLFRGHALNPHGVTFGVVYDFSGFRRRY